MTARPSVWWNDGAGGRAWQSGQPKSRDPWRCLAKETVLIGGMGCLGPANPALEHLGVELDSSLSYGSAVSVSRSLFLEVEEHLGREAGR